MCLYPQHVSKHSILFHKLHTTIWQHRSYRYLRRPGRRTSTTAAFRRTSSRRWPLRWYPPGSRTPDVTSPPSPLIPSPIYTCSLTFSLHNTSTAGSVRPGGRLGGGAGACVAGRCISWGCIPSCRLAGWLGGRAGGRVGLGSDHRHHLPPRPEPLPPVKRQGVATSVGPNPHGQAQWAAGRGVEIPDRSTPHPTLMAPLTPLPHCCNH